MNMHGGMTARAQAQAHARLLEFIKVRHAEWVKRLDEQIALTLYAEGEELKSDMEKSIGRWSPDA